MKLTRAASYALQAVVHIANKSKKKEKDTVASHDIADDLGIPDRFLLKVLKPLVGAQILQSIKGPNGGYSLARAPSDITMLEVIECVEGPIRGLAPLNSVSINNDPARRSARDFPLRKRFEEVTNQVAEQTRKQLSKVKVSELTSKH